MCQKLSDDQLEKISDKVVEKLKIGRTGRGALSSEDIAALKTIAHVNKTAVKIILYVAGVMAIWALKDIYLYAVDLLKFKWGH